MNVHGIDWDLAEVHATGSPTYLAGIYDGRVVETFYLRATDDWRWSFYDSPAHVHYPPVADGIEPTWREAVEAAKDYIDGAS